MFAIRSLIAVSLVSLMGCVSGNGRLETRAFFESDFEAIAGSDAVELELTRGETFSIEVTADDNLWDHVLVQREGKTLTVGYGSPGYVMGTLRAKVTMPALTGLELSGSSRADLTGFAPTVASFRVTASGGSMVNGAISTDALTCELSGGSKVVLSGNAGQAILGGSGGSDFDLKALTAREAKVTLSGGSVTDVTVEQQLDYELSGGSKLVFGGNPRVGVNNTSGSSTATQR